jgi:PAS domain S-box-containing protein
VISFAAVAVPQGPAPGLSFAWFAVVCLAALAGLAWLLWLRGRDSRQLVSLRAQLRRERALSEVGRKLASATSVDAAARIIADVTADLFGWDAFFLNLYSAELDRMELVINIDTVEGRRVDVPGDYPAGKPTSLTREIVEHGAKLVLRDQAGAGDVPALSPFGDTARRSASLMFVPIRDSARIIGILSAQSYTAQFYDESKLASLQTLADHCGGALERIRTRQELQRAHDELEARVAQRTGQLTEANARLRQAEEEQRRKIEERTAQLSEAVARLESEIAERRQAELRARNLSRLGQELSAATTATAAAQAVLDAADRLLGWDAAYLYLYTPDQRYTVPVLLFDNVGGKRTQVFGVYREISARDKRIIEHGAELVQGPVPPSQPAFVPFGARSRPTASRLFAPIHSGPKVIGALSVQSDKENAYQQADVGVLQTLADFCSATLERIEVEQSLRRSEERFSKAFRSSPVPMALTTLEQGVYLDANESLLRLFGFQRQEMLGRTTLELGVWAEPEERLRMLEQLHKTKGVRDFACRLRAKDGALHDVLLAAERLDFSGETVILSILHDMTERLNLEAQLRQSQKMEAVGQLAAGVAHDFNNVLTIIQGHVDLLLSKAELPENFRKPLEQVAAAADQAGTLTKHLLTFSRKQVMQVRRRDLNEIVRGTADMLQRLLGENIALQLQYAPAVLPINADVGMIEQTIVNLALNARDAMPGGGQLRVATDTMEFGVAGAPQHPEAREGRFACLTVADTGTGMDEATLNRIFEPFFTTKEAGKGTGLGLATAYGIVQQHGGWIEVSSAVGSGTLFSLYLPLCAEAAKTEALDRAPSPPPRGHEMILLVEDETNLRLLVSSLLEYYGYRVLEAVHGKDALRIWREKAGEIDLLLTDMMMPEGVSGWELAGQLQREKPGLKVIYTSGYSVDLLGRDGVLHEGLNFLPKPYHPDTLAKTVRNCLDA